MNNKKKLAVRIMAWVLAGLMVISGAVITITMIAQNIQEAQEEAEK